MPEETRNWFGIFFKITMGMLFVALIPIIVSGIFNLQMITREITRHVETTLAAEAGKLATLVDDWVEMNRRMLAQNARLAPIRSMEPAFQNPVLRSITETYDWVYLAFTVDTAGMNIGRSDDAPPKDYSDRQYVKQVLEGAPLGQQVLIGKTSGQPALVLAAPVREEGAQLRGIIAIAMRLTDLSRRITDTTIGDSGYAFLLDSAGEVIAHPAAALASSRKDLSAHPAFAALREGKERIVYTDENGSRMMAVPRKTAHDWVVVVQQEYGEAYAPVRLARWSALVTLVATALAVFLVAHLVSHRLTVPIRRLTRVADDLSHGALDHQIPEVNRRDEIGALARAIDRLGASVRYAMERLNRKR